MCTPFITIRRAFCRTCSLWSLRCRKSGWLATTSCILGAVTCHAILTDCLLVDQISSFCLLYASKHGIVSLIRQLLFSSIVFSYFCNKKTIHIDMDKLFKDLITNHFYCFYINLNRLLESIVSKLLQKHTTFAKN